MKISEILPTIENIIANDPNLSAIPIIVSSDANFNKNMHASLEDPGVCMVLTLSNAQLVEAPKTLIHLSNAVTISVVENPVKNKSQKHAIDVVEHLLICLNAASQRRGRVDIQVDKEPYETGPIEGGLVVYFVNLNATTINP